MTQRLGILSTLQQNFVANDMKDAYKCHAILLSACEQLTYKVIRNLVTPKKPAESKNDDITE